ncbi:hypothetical protein [Deinococcus maricopensis]|uniref:Uncharacterized protein n=1 Tax=Deinococcus maricopensis (strain DSM 21211 / LMG 22137 / NRRL B-23946 / LB-34) TaxID=709986 RepID=E8UAU5_DEIML|nr:hypothetical protein [Deinococcus maricopensis]ADV68184.1 hypothetical protein Deima_2550 [Deinococcus maricopensis DSM 21211]
MTAHDPLLLHEGDRLARHLAQILHAGADEQARVDLIGRSLTVNLVAALLPTIEQISRHAGQPLHAQVIPDERDRALVQVINAHGEEHARLPVDDVLRDALTTAGHLHPTIRAHLEDALRGSEHHLERALVAALRSAPVMNALRQQLTALLRQRR